MFALLLLIIPVIIVVCAIVLAIMVKIEDSRAHKREKRDRALAELEYARAMQDIRQSRLDEIEKELTHLEIKRERLLHLYDSRTEAQQISIDDKIYTIDKKIDKLIAERAAL